MHMVGETILEESRVLTLPASVALTKNVTVVKCGREPYLIASPLSQQVYNGRAVVTPISGSVEGSQIARQAYIRFLSH